MQHPSRIIIADTSCFILLDKIDYLQILQLLFGQVTTTTEVLSEFGKRLPGWVSIENVKDRNQQLLLEAEIDKGEASAIALAMENKNSLLILDDYKARKTAAKYGLQFTGTLGLFLKAKEETLISAIRPILERIQQTDFRFSEGIYLDILKEANE
jgi:predicted nucleic acid-binding protein